MIFVLRRKANKYCKLFFLYPFHPSWWSYPQSLRKYSFRVIKYIENEISQTHWDRATCPSFLFFLDIAELSCQWLCRGDSMLLRCQICICLEFDQALSINDSSGKRQRDKNQRNRVCCEIMSPRNSGSFAHKVSLTWLSKHELNKDKQTNKTSIVTWIGKRPWGLNSAQELRTPKKRWEQK